MIPLDEKSLKKMVQMLTSKPHTVQDLADAFNRSPRTVHRWVNVLIQRGHYVAREGISQQGALFIIP